MTNDQPFSPLTAAEKAVGKNVAKIRDWTWTPITPVPDDVPLSFPPHRSGTPVDKWPYRDADAKRLFFACRFDLGGGKKDVLPLSYCEGPKGRREWRWQGLTTPRPLNGLDRLAARPDAPVLVVEGEKKTAPAMDIFPEFVAVTSPNGAKAADRADWSPMRSRAVTIWPDHDDEGLGYARDVARLAFTAGAVSVSIVDVPSTFPPKWDLADTPPEGVTTDDLRRLLSVADPAVDAAPAVDDADNDEAHAPNPLAKLFRMKPTGLWFIPPPIPRRARN